MSTNIERWHPSANIGIRKMVFGEIGDVVPVHFHNFAHTMYCVKGELLVDVLDEADTVLVSRVLAPGESAVIDADKRHRVTALKPGSEGDCIFAHRTPQGDVVQEYTGWEEAHMNRANSPTPDIMAALSRGENTHGVS